MIEHANSSVARTASYAELSTRTWEGPLLLCVERENTSMSSKASLADSKNILQHPLTHACCQHGSCEKVRDYQLAGTIATEMACFNCVFCSLSVQGYSLQS